VRDPRPRGRWHQAAARRSPAPMARPTCRRLLPVLDGHRHRPPPVYRCQAPPQRIAAADNACTAALTPRAH
jgi:hypothetical protein